MTECETCAQITLNNDQNMVLLQPIEVDEPFTYLTVTWYSHINDLLLISTNLTMLGLLASVTLSHWIFISQIHLTSSSSTTPPGQCSTTSLFSQSYDSHTISNGPILQLCRIFSYTQARLIFYIHIYAAELPPFRHTFYVMDCQFCSLCNLSLMLGHGEHISLPQFAL